MKKIFKKLKESKIINSIIDLAADSLPFGTTARKVVSNLWTDKNDDNKMQFNEIRWDLIGGLVAVAVLLRFEIVTVEGLTSAANMILKVMGG